MSINLSERAINITPSVTLAITAKACAMKASGKNIISFGAGEPDFDTPELIKNTAIEAIKNGVTKYTPAGGTTELKKAILNRYLKKGLKYTEEEVVVNCGAKHSLYNIFQVILNPGDEVIVFSPYWVSYPEMIKLAGGEMILVETKQEKGFLPAIQDFQKAISCKRDTLPFRGGHKKILGSIE